MAVATFEGLSTGAVTAAAAGFDFLSAPTGGGCTIISINPFRGTRAMQLLTGSSGALCLAERGTSLGANSSGQVYLRTRFRMPSLPDATGVRVMVITDSTGAFLAEVRVINTGKLQLRNSSGTVQATSTATITADQWVDVGLAILVFSATVGQAQMRLWDTSTGAVSETLTSSANLNTLQSGGANRAQFGAIRSGVNNFAVVIDDADTSLTDYPSYDISATVADDDTVSTAVVSATADVTAGDTTNSTGDATADLAAVTVEAATSSSADAAATAALTADGASTSAASAVPVLAVTDAAGETSSAGSAVADRPMAVEGDTVSDATAHPAALAQASGATDTTGVAPAAAGAGFVATTVGAGAAAVAASVTGGGDTGSAGAASVDRLLLVDGHTISTATAAALARVAAAGSLVGTFAVAAQARARAAGSSANWATAGVRAAYAVSGSTTSGFAVTDASQEHVVHVAPHQVSDTTLAATVRRTR